MLISMAWRPFADRATLQAEAEQVWQSLREADYLQAFDGHPKIGDPDSLKKKYAATHGMASQEQSGVKNASDDVIQQLAQYNDDYEIKFGFIFIVCASGKSAIEMLDLIKARLPNSRAEEIANAAGEQQKITAIRLNALLTDDI